MPSINPCFPTYPLLRLIIAFTCMIWTKQKDLFAESFQHLTQRTIATSIKNLLWRNARRSRAMIIIYIIINNYYNIIIILSAPEICVDVTLIHNYCNQWKQHLRFTCNVIAPLHIKSGGMHVRRKLVFHDGTRSDHSSPIGLLYIHHLTPPPSLRWVSHFHSEMQSTASILGGLQCPVPWSQEGHGFDFTS